MVATPQIYSAMIGVMRDVEHVAKGQKNQAQGYKFRGVDDVYLALHAVLAKHGVFTTSDILEERTEERTTQKGSVLIYRILRIKYTFWALDGSSVSTVVVGEGQDSGDKASNKAMSVAHKYALLQAFCIPTDEPKDPENDSPGHADGGLKPKYQIPAKIHPDLLKQDIEKFFIKGEAPDAPMSGPQKRYSHILEKEGGWPLDDQLGFLRAVYGVQGWGDVLNGQFQHLCFVAKYMKPDKASALLKGEFA